MTTTGRAEWLLVWADEFEQTDGSAPNPANWTHDIGRGISGWGNSELQYYTDSPDNVRIENNQLVIELRDDTGLNGNPDLYFANDYTSARLKTQGLRSWRYGKIEARIRLPFGDTSGLWPAFWMLGTDIVTEGRPGCGQIDVMDYVSRLPNEIFGSVHGPGYSGGASFGAGFDYTQAIAPPAPPLLVDPYDSAYYHTYRIEWEPGEIRWYVDDIQFHSANPSDIAPNEWVFDDEFFIILNLAIGGNYGGVVDAANLSFPTQMLVDYIRVYRDTALDVLPVEVPGIVEAENFRDQFGVEVLPATDLGGGEKVGFLTDGDWLEFDLAVPIAGTYEIDLRVANGSGLVGSLILSAGTDFVASPGIHNTGSWETWETITAGRIDLPEGNVTLRIDSTTQGGNAPDINWIKLSPVPEISLTKSGTFVDENADGIAQAGETISYTFATENSGTMPVTGVFVSDPMVSIVDSRFQTNLLQNGDFEIPDLSMWTFNPPGSPSIAYMLTPISQGSGSNSLVMQLFDATTATARQAFPANPGDEFRLSGYIQNEVILDPGTLALFKIVFKDSSGEDLTPASVSKGQFAPVANPGAESLPFVNISSPPLQWIFSEAQATAPEGTTAVEFYALVFGAGPLNFIYFDSVEAIDVTGPSLAPGAVDDTTYSASYTLTQADIDAGKVLNTATADSLESGPAEAQEITRLAEIGLTKSGTFLDENGNGLGDVGETIKYTFNLENTGFLPLSGLSVTDPLVSSESLFPNLLANGNFETNDLTGWSSAGDVLVVSDIPGESASVYSLRISGSGGITIPVASQTLPASAGDEFRLSGYLYTPSPIPPGETFGLFKIVFLDGVGGELEPASISLGQSAPIAAPGAESLPFLDAFSPVGTWIYSETQAVAPANTAEVLFLLLNVDEFPADMYFDSVEVTKTGAQTIGSLDIGEFDSSSFTARYAISQADIDAGQVFNEATAVSTESDPASAQAITPIGQNPALSFTKTGSLVDSSNDGFADAGESIQYVFTLTNTGNVTLTDLSVLDPLVTVESFDDTLPTSLIESGEFEDGDLTGWSIFGNITASTANPLNGVYSLQVEAAGGFTVPAAYQALPAEPGDEFRLTGFALAASPLPFDGTFGLLKIVFRDSGGFDLEPASVSAGSFAAPDSPGAESGFLDASSPPGYQPLTVQAVAPAGTVEAVFFVIVVDESPATLFFDAIDVFNVDEIIGPSLTVGEFNNHSFTASYVITEADINAGLVLNTASATSRESPAASDEDVTLLEVDPDLDSDRDGFLNIFERAFLLDIFSPDLPDKGPFGYIADVDGQDYIHLEYRRRTGGRPSKTDGDHIADGLIYTVQVSDDLTNWESGRFFVQQVGTPFDNGDGTETVTMRATAPVSGGRTFIRLKVSGSLIPPGVLFSAPAPAW